MRSWALALFVYRLHVGASVDEDADALAVVGRRRRVQGGPAVVHGAVVVGVRLEQQLDDGVAVDVVARRVVHRRSQSQEK